jgi:hypothetical protein
VLTADEAILFLRQIGRNRCYLIPHCLIPGPPSFGSFFPTIALGELSEEESGMHSAREGAAAGGATTAAAARLPAGRRAYT